MPESRPVDATAPAEWKSTLEIVAYVKKSVPWLGNPILTALKRELGARELARVGEVIATVVSGLKGFSSELSELYVKTQDFQRLLEQILVRVTDEPQEMKRHIYHAFLLESITSPCDPFEKQLAFLRALKELRLDQLRILRAVAVPPDTRVLNANSSLHMLQMRLPDVHRDRIEGLLAQMDDLGMIRIDDLKASKAGTGRAPADSITPLGRKLLTFMQSAP